MLQSLHRLTAVPLPLHKGGYSLFKILRQDWKLPQSRQSRDSSLGEGALIPLRDHLIRPRYRSATFPSRGRFGSEQTSV